MTPNTISELQVLITAQTKDLKRELEGVSKEAGGIGKRAGTAFTGALKKAARVGMVAAGAAAATALFTGFRTAVSRQNSELVLGGLYGDAEAATNMMQQLRDTVKDSPIDYTEYLKAGEGLAYAGIQGKDAVDILENVGLALTGAGKGGDAMGSVTEAMTTMVNKGRVQMQELNRVSQAGVPIMSALQNHFGVSAEKLQEMISAGEVGFDDVVSVLSDLENMGDIAAGSIASGEAAQKSFGNVSKATFDQIKNGVADVIQPLLERLTPAIETVGSAFGRFFDWINENKGEIKGFIANIVDGFKEFKRIIQPAIDLVVDTFKNDLLPTLKELWDFISPVLIPVLKIVGAIIGLAIVGAIGLLAVAFKVIVEVLKIVVKSFINGWTSIKDTWDVVAGYFSGVWEKIKEAWAPVIDFFTNLFRSAWEGVKNYWSQAVGFYRGVWNGIKNVFRSVGSWFGSVFRGAYNAVTNIFSRLRGFFSGIWNSIVGLFRGAGSRVGNAIGGTFKNVINSILGQVARIINGFIGAINGAVGTINNIPGVSIGKLSKLSVPHLAQGGIVTAPTLAMVGEGGQSEAVIPLDKLENMMGSKTPVNVQLDGRTLLSFVIDGINNDSFMSNETAINV